MSEGRQDIGGGAALPAAAAAIAAGYTFTGPALDLGALLWEGTAHPGARVAVPLSVLNRHGLVAGATGTGKTKTLQVVAEQLSAQGVPAFLADVKGDLSGVSAPGAGGDRVQHALRAFTPDDAKALRATVSTFPRSAYDLGELLTGLGTGEAVVSVLGEDGAPTPVAATRLRAPESLMGPLDPAGLDSAVRGSGLYGRYAEAVDRESAYEKQAAASAAAEAVSRPPAAAPGGGRESGAAGRTTGGAAGKAAGGADDEESLVEQVVHSGMFKSLTRSVGTQVGREITRSLFGVRRR